jgi:translocator protein
MTRKKVSPRTDWKKLIGAILLCEFAGVIGSLFTFQAIPTWYVYLNKPVFSPPNWVFGPVWTVLYFLMGVSLYLIWRSKPSLQKGFAEKLFYTQLALNAAWSILFFGLQNPLVAFIEIIIMWILILFTIIASWKLNKNAGFLLVPYILWVSFASILNLAIVVLN